MTWLYVAVVVLVVGWNAYQIIKKTAQWLRGLPDSAATREIDRASGISRRRKPAEAAERILDADEVREVEHKLGVGPFAGRENYCDLTKCTSQNHTHEDVDSETMTGKAVPKPPGNFGAKRFLLAENPQTVVARDYVTGQAPEVAPFAAKEKTMDELTLAEAEKLMMAGILPPSVLMEALGDHSVTYARGFAESPAPGVDPNLTKWKGWRAIFRADQLAQEGRPLAGYCTSSLHEHVNIATMDGVVRRRCENY